MKNVKIWKLRGRFCVPIKSLLAKSMGNNYRTMSSSKGMAVNYGINKCGIKGRCNAYYS